LGAVDRIEILNHGGSATYGTDAIAGVVNLILKSDYQGADIFNYYGISQRGDHETYHGYLVSGLTEKFSDTSKLSIVTAVDYYTSSPIMQDDRADTQLIHSLYSYKYPSSVSAFPQYPGQFSDAAGNFYQVIPGTKGPTVSTSDFLINAGKAKWLYSYFGEWPYPSSHVCFINSLE
jgi:outer membrane receptor protein involved in Fe transport